MAMGAMAETGTLEFTYADGELFSFGNSRKETVNVAIRLADPNLEGKKVTAIRAYINTSEGIANTSIWLSSALKVENKVNIPDIASFSVTPQASGIGNLSMLEVVLDEPYLLTGEPVYAGYSLTVTDVAGVPQEQPVILSRGVNTDGFYIYASQSILKWQDYSVKSGGVAYIVVEIEGDYPAYSCQLTGGEAAYAEPGKDFTADFSIRNTGLNPIESLTYTYTFDDTDAIYQGTATLPVPIAPSLSLSATARLSFQGVETVGKHRINVNVTKVNGNPNEEQAGPMESDLYVIPFVPVHRPLVEEYTGLWCGWCTGGWLAMEMIAEKYGDSQVSISYHDNDKLAVTNVFAMPVGEFPVSSIDRQSLIDPYFGTYNGNTQFGISYDIDDAIATLTPVAIEVTAESSETEVAVNTAVKFVRDFDDSNFEIGYVLTCSGLTDPTWRQNNYYAGRTDLEGTPLEVLTTWPDPVRGLIYNDVAVDVNGMMGVEGSLPEVIEEGREYTSTHTFDISDNELIQDPANLTVAAFVIDKATGKILNSNSCRPVSSGVESLSRPSEDTLDIYTLQGHCLKRGATPADIKTLPKGLYIIGSKKVLL